LTDVTDGTSTTAAVAEVANGWYTPTPNPPRTKLDCYEYGSTPIFSTLTAARSAFLARSWTTAGLAQLGGDWRFRGYPYSEGSPWRGWYNHLLPPNSPCWRPNNWWLIVSPASSYHAGGV